MTADVKSVTFKIWHNLCLQCLISNNCVHADDRQWSHYTWLHLQKYDVEMCIYYCMDWLGHCLSIWGEKQLLFTNFLHYSWSNIKQCWETPLFMFLLEVAALTDGRDRQKYHSENSKNHICFHTKALHKRDVLLNIQLLNYSCNSLKGRHYRRKHVLFVFFLH